MVDVRPIVATVILLSGCGGDGGGGAPDAPDAPIAIDAPEVDARQPIDYMVPTIPVSDLLVDRYKGYAGGQYPGGNAIPADHLAAGMAKAALIQPRAVDGTPSANGRYVLMSIGMSNATQEWCAGNGSPPCTPNSFTGQALADVAVERTELAIVNGALGSQTCTAWDDATDTNWNRVQTLLANQGFGEAQVQAIWLKCANPQPTMALPASGSHAYQVETGMANIIRIARQRYPNLQMVFVSNRIYAGYATTTLNPEPHAYETGFAVKWLVAAQIEQARNGTVDPRAGDLALATTPWIGWGPDLWANGTTPRSDGLTYVRSNLAADGTHPSATGVTKVGGLLLAFFKTSPVTSCWFLAGRSC